MGVRPASLRAVLQVMSANASRSINKNNQIAPKIRIREARAGGSHRDRRSQSTDAEGEAARVPFHPFYRCTLPDASPPIRFLASLTETRLKSPEIECFRQLAATANSSDC